MIAKWTATTTRTIAVAVRPRIQSRDSTPFGNLSESLVTDLSRNGPLLEPYGPSHIRYQTRESRQTKGCLCCEQTSAKRSR